MISTDTKRLNSYMYKMCIPLWNAFSNYPYAIVKGEVLSVYAYNEPGLRHFGDIDILLDKRNIKVFEEILSFNGFVTRKTTRTERIMLLSASHQVTPWSKRLFGNINIMVDLNFDIFWGEYTGKRVTMFTFLNDIMEMSIHGCVIKTLPPLKAFVQLVLHHYKEINSIYHLVYHNSICSDLFTDVYYFWKNNRKMISKESLRSISESYDIIPYIYYVMYYTNIIFNDIDLAGYVSMLENAEGHELLDWYGLSENERKRWKVDFNTRLHSNALWEIIEGDLTIDDITKLKRNHAVFEEML